ncbi:MAG: hypothetical protein KC505_02705 [Myxococcales bacterium]|nr:hypothetical protein [Myxococcales bacterium]USN50274.1 MAG: hypothetical protein H6731_08380 [Myxococcales bacterium]
MKNYSSEQLEELCERLNSWPEEELDHLDAFIIHNLEIFGALTQDYDSIKNIGIELSLIVKTRPRLEECLKEQFLEIDDCLEKDLRGFSSLFDYVLEESVIRVDTCAVLNKLPQRYQVFLKPLEHLASQVAALSDLEVAFEIGKTKTIPLLFLLALQKVFSLKFAWSIEKARSILGQWLLKQKNNCCLGSILQAKIDFFELYSTLRHCQSELIGWQEVMLAFLSEASLQRLVLPAETFVMFEGILNKMELDGLLPLLESGFISIEGYENSHLGAKIFHVI